MISSAIIIAHNLHAIILRERSSQIVLGWNHRHPKTSTMRRPLVFQMSITNSFEFHNDRSVTINTGGQDYRLSLKIRLLKKS